MTTQIIVADDHPLFRSAISHLLSRLIKNTQISEVDSFSSLLSILTVSDTLPSLVLLDLKLPDTQGLDGLLELKKQYPALPIVVVSAYDDIQVIKNTQQYGASGFISKSQEMEYMAKAISSILEGNLWFPESIISETEENQSTIAFDELTPAQLKVFYLLKEGKPSKLMADMIGVTEATIKAHLTVIFRKLGVTNRTQAVVLAKRLDVPDVSFDS